MRTAIRCAALAVAAVVSVADVASAADDSGVHAFLSNMFGEAGRTASAPVAVPVTREVRTAPVYRRIARSRPLTIVRRRPTMVAAVGPTKPAKVSIFEDTTLRPGDAVMMSDGVRIFAGSRSWPYTKADFVALAQAHDLSRDTVKVLAGLNSLPRS